MFSFALISIECRFCMNQFQDILLSSQNLSQPCLILLHRYNFPYEVLITRVGTFQLTYG